MCAQHIHIIPINKQKHASVNAERERNRERERERESEREREKEREREYERKRVDERKKRSGGSLLLMCRTTPSTALPYTLSLPHTHTHTHTSHTRPPAGLWVIL